MEQIVDGAARDFIANESSGPQEYFVYPQGVCHIRKPISSATAILYFKGLNCAVAVKDPQNRRQAVQETCPSKKGAGRISHSPRCSSRFAYER